MVILRPGPCAIPTGILPLRVLPLCHLQAKHTQAKVNQDRIQLDHLLKFFFETVGGCQPVL